MNIVCDIYCRVSTTEQAEEGYSIGEQEERLKKYAEAQNWQIHDVCTDGGFSGKDLNRPAVQRVMQDAREKKINKLLVYKLDRLSRSQKDTLYLIEEVFIPNGVDFCSMTETLDTGTPLGMAMIGILSVFAQLERETIKERMMLGRDARVRSGKYHGNSNNVLGYVYDKTSGALKQNEYDAMMVRNIFYDYVHGSSESAIARKLNEQRWKGHQWTAGKVKRILKQPLYIGYQRWKGNEIQVEGCPSIISDDLWSKAQREMAKRAPDNPNRQIPGRHVTLLGGLLWCGCCGARYNGVKSHDGYRYYCYSRVFKRHGLDAPECHNRGWRADILDNIVIDELRQIKIDWQDREPDVGNIDDGKLETLSKKLKSIDAQQDKLIELYSLDGISAGALQKRIDKLNGDRETVEKQIAELKKPGSRLSTAQLRETVNSFNEVVEACGGDYMGLYDIVHTLIQSITLTDDNIKIIWNI